MRNLADHTAIPGGVGHRRTALIAVGLVGVLGVAVGLAIVARPSGSTATAGTATSVSDPLRIVARIPITAGPIATTTTTTTATTTTTSTTAAATPETDVVSVPGPPPTTPSPTTTRTTTTTTLPPIRLDPAITASLPVPATFGPDVLVWTAPFELHIATGRTATLSVVAHNPTNRVATLPHPLSCAPRLDHDERCTQNVQLVGAGQSASAEYTIDARGIAPGNYTLDIEGVLTVGVTVS